jgi:quercetin dioxygenase-like cupin family protein
MARPESPEHGLDFDLATIAEAMRSEPAYLGEGHTARTLVRTPDLRVVLIAMQAGSRLERHQVDETASLQVLAGRVRVGLPDRMAEIGLHGMLVLGRSIPHDVEASVASTVVLTFGWSAG